MYLKLRAYHKIKRKIIIIKKNSSQLFLTNQIQITRARRRHTFDNTTKSGQLVSGVVSMHAPPPLRVTRKFYPPAHPARTFSTATLSRSLPAARPAGLRPSRDHLPPAPPTSPWAFASDQTLPKFRKTSAISRRIRRNRRRAIENNRERPRQS